MFSFSRWQAEIAKASTEAELVRIMREYCDTVLPSEMALLPLQCRVSGIRAGDEIAEVAVELTKCELLTRRSEEQFVLLHEMALTFNAALTRLRQLRGRAVPQR